MPFLGQAAGQLGSGGLGTFQYCGALGLAFRRSPASLQRFFDQVIK